MLYNSSKKSLNISLFIIFIFLSIFSYFVIGQYSKIPPKTFANESSGKADEVRDGYIPDGKVVGYFKYGKYKHAVIAIPTWQDEIYNELGIPFEYKLILRTLNTAECGNENGFCLGGNHSDSGPFQINQIHGTDHTYSEGLVVKGIKESQRALKTGNWGTVINIRNELFRFQAKWTYERVKRFSKRCKADKLYKIMKCQGILHNGSKAKYSYGNKVAESIKILYNFYK